MLATPPHTKHIIHVAIFIVGIAIGATAMWMLNAHAQCMPNDLNCMNLP